MTDIGTPHGQMVFDRLKMKVHPNWLKDAIVAIEADMLELAATAVKAIPSCCHSHSGLDCEKDAYGWCYLIDRGAVLKILEEPVGVPRDMMGKGPSR